MSSLGHIFRAATTLSALTGASALYSFAILALGLTVFSLPEYGKLTQIIAAYGLLTRIIAWGFEFQLRDVLDAEQLQNSELVLGKALLFVPAALIFLLINALIWRSDFSMVMVLGLLSFCFNTQVYYQAVSNQREIIFSVVLGLAIGVVFIAICVFQNAVTPTTYLVAILIAPNIGWVTSFLFGMRQRREILNVKRSFRAVTCCTQMLPLS